MNSVLNFYNLCENRLKYDLLYLCASNEIWKTVTAESLNASCDLEKTVDIVRGFTLFQFPAMLF